MVDQFFTPFEIASKSLKHLVEEKINIVADFSIGDGNLINALPYKPKTVVGLDLDGKIIKRLKSKHPSWKLSTGNFIHSTSRTNSWLSQWKGKIDLIILNPPFSCRGGNRVSVQLDGNKIQCRTYLAFVITSLQYLNESGKLIAILPLSFLKSESDRIHLDALSKEWQITHGQRYGRYTFLDCSPNSIVVTFTKKKHFQFAKLEVERNEEAPNKFEVEIIRGAIRMYETKEKGKFKVIHTTNLKNGTFFRQGLRATDKESRLVSGHFLCIPRVGLPNRNKIIVARINKPHILSDCVIAIRAISEIQTEMVKQLILESWLEFVKLFDSTCAPYITINQLCIFLQSKGVGTKKVSEFSSIRRAKTKRSKTESIFSN